MTNPDDLSSQASTEAFAISALAGMQTLMVRQSPLLLSQFLLSSLGTELSVVYRDRIPQDQAILVVSNHRSYMDAPLLMVALNQPIRFACHPYMGQVPVLRNIVQALGCFPLGRSQKGQQHFLKQANHWMHANQSVGIFPEGGQPMVQLTQPNCMERFQRGFAHLAMRLPLSNLVVLPVAIAAQTETTYPAVPLNLLRLFDPSESLFENEGWHPLVTYRGVKVLVGRPHHITPAERAQYRGKQAHTMVVELTERCQSEIAQLLQQGCA